MKQKDLTQLAHDLGTALGDILPIIAVHASPRDPAALDALLELQRHWKAQGAPPTVLAFTAALGTRLMHP